MMLCKSLTRRSVAGAVLLAVLVVGSCDGPVAPPPPVATWIQITGADSLRVGETITLTGAVLDQDGNAMAGKTIAWSSDNEAVANISSGGVVTAEAAGEVTFTATHEALVATHQATVHSSPALVLAADSVVLTALSETHKATGTVDGQTVPVTLMLIDEARHNSGLAVATAAGSNLNAVGAGEVRFQASASGATSDTLTVIVRPTDPYIAAISADGPLGPGTSLVLEGYGLESTTAEDYRIGADQPALSVLDSARIALSVPALAAGTCAGGRTTFSLADSLVTMLTDAPNLSRARDGEVALDVGEAMRLESADLACLKLAEGEYALALYDARFVYPKTWQAFAKSGGFSVSAADVSAASAAATSSAWTGAKISISASAADDFHIESTVHSGDWREETTQWQVGDTIATYRSAKYTGSIEVLRVIDEFQVLTAPVDSVIGAEVLDSLVAQYGAFNQAVRPGLKALFGGDPGTPNGQYLVVLLPNGDAPYLAANATSQRTELTIGTRGHENNESLYRVIVHELVHSYEQVRIAELRDRNAGVPNRERWNAEGLADFVAYRAVVERFGYTLASNPMDYEIPGLREMFAFTGAIESGYINAATVLWALTDELAAGTGMSWTEAHDSVQIATMMNRWGCAEALSTCDFYEGLYEMMARRLGGDWEPIDAILRITLREALDDQTQIGWLQNPHIRRPPRGLIPPLATIEAYSGAEATGSLYLVGSVARFNLNANEPAAFRVTSDETTLAWMLVRYR